MCGGEVTCFKPNLVSYAVRNEMCGKFYYQFLGMSDGFLGVLSRIIDVLESFFHRRDCQRTCDLVDTGYMSHDEFKWSFLCGGAGPRVVSILCYWK